MANSLREFWFRAVNAALWIVVLLSLLSMAFGFLGTVALFAEGLRNWFHTGEGGSMTWQLLLFIFGGVFAFNTALDELDKRDSAYRDAKAREWRAQQEAD